ncbi:MAG: EscU/YscU/HrcU family type III secretion system export apparatus switch protein [Planctomycetota bacterium]|jgi:flagellar biosynthetic protein FlhB
MSDSNQDRTEAPTPRRRKEARERGQIPKSTDLTGGIVLLGAMMVLYFLGQGILERLVMVTRGCLGAWPGNMTDVNQTVPVLASAFHQTAAMVLSVMLMVLVLALVASFVQVGPLFTLKPIKPSLARIHPGNGLKRMFDARCLVHLLMVSAKLLLLCLVAYWTLHSRIDLLARTPGMHPLPMLAVVAEMVFILGIRMTIVLLVLGIIDYLYQRWRTEKDLRMTRYELKDELRRMEGDPQLKRRRREVQMQITLNRIQVAVPRSAMVVTYPTESAVALEYDPETMTAPKVSAKGGGLLARRIGDLAVQNGISVVEGRTLARLLYKQVQVGQEIPQHLYKDVAEILAYAYEVSGMRERVREKGDAALLCGGKRAASPFSFHN